MTRLDTVDIDALTNTLRADAKAGADEIQAAAAREALALTEYSEDLIKNIRIAQDCYKLSKDMFSGAELACVAETNILERFAGQGHDGYEPVQVQGIELMLNTHTGQASIHFAHISPSIVLPAARYRFVLIGYRLPEADAGEG